eukprot:Nk52_evm43s207 gene=Nk52_evmTU43s207
MLTGTDAKRTVVKNQAIVLTLTWIAYVSSYLVRKPFSVVKANMEEEFHYSRSLLGLMDSAFLFPYAVGQLSLSFLTDKYGARNMLSVGLMGSALAMITFGLWNDFYIFIALLFLNGLFQSMHYINCVAVIGPWLPESSRAIVYGIWGSCSSVGGLIGTWFTVIFLNAYGWRMAFVPPSIVVLVITAIQYCMIKSPKEAGVESPNAISRSQSAEQLSISFYELLCIPSVTPVSVCYFCVKFIRYSLLMWLPLYFYSKLGYTQGESAMLAITFEVGGSFGSPFLGFISSLCFGGANIRSVMFSQFLVGVSLIVFFLTSHLGPLSAGASMVFVGFFSAGSCMQISGCIACELGDRDERPVQGRVIGLINSMGSLGSVAQGPAIGVVADLCGWDGVFIMLVIIAFASSAFLVTSVANERTFLAKARVDEESPLLQTTIVAGTDIESGNEKSKN